MTTTRKLKGLIKPNAKIKRLIDYPPAVWMAMAEDFSDAWDGIYVDDETGSGINYNGICAYLLRILCNNYSDDKSLLFLETMSYDLVTKEAKGNEYPFDDNDERVLFCLMMYQLTKTN